MALQREFDGRTYDSFYGRCIDFQGNETYVSLDLTSEGLSSHTPDLTSVHSIVKGMVIDVREGREVLLDRSPGQQGQGESLRVYVPFHPEMQFMLKHLVRGISDKSLVEPTSLTSCAGQ